MKKKSEVICPKCKKEFEISNLDKNESFKKGIKTTCPGCNEEVIIHTRDKVKKNNIENKSIISDNEINFNNIISIIIALLIFYILYYKFNSSLIITIILGFVSFVWFQTFMTNRSKNRIRNEHKDKQILTKK